MRIIERGVQFKYGLWLTVWVCITAFLTILAQDEKGDEKLQGLVGSWVLKSIYPTRSVAGIGVRQQRALLGTRISYGLRVLRSCSQSAPIKSVETHSLSTSELFAGTYVEFGDLGIQSSSVTEVVIDETQAGNCFGTYSLPGEDLYLKAKDELIVNFDGVFYRAVRDKQ